MPDSAQTRSSSILVRVWKGNETRVVRVPLTERRRVKILRGYRQLRNRGRLYRDDLRGWHVREDARNWALAEADPLRRYGRANVG